MTALCLLNVHRTTMIMVSSQSNIREFQPNTTTTLCLLTIYRTTMIIGGSLPSLPLPYHYHYLTITTTITSLLPSNYHGMRLPPTGPLWLWYACRDGCAPCGWKSEEAFPLWGWVSVPFTLRSFVQAGWGCYKGLIKRICWWFYSCACISHVMPCIFAVHFSSLWTVRKKKYAFILPHIFSLCFLDLRALYLFSDFKSHARAKMMLGNFMPQGFKNQSVALDHPVACTSPSLPMWFLVHPW